MTDRWWLALSAALIAVLDGASPVAAHSWYPPLCCNEMDCMVANRVVRNSDGSITMEAGHITVVVPRGFAIDSSQDREAHVCVYRDIMGRYRPRCVFLPAES